MKHIIRMVGLLCLWAGGSALVHASEGVNQAGVDGRVPEAADTTGQRMVITKNDGTTYIGVVLSDNGREVDVMTESIGRLILPKAEIKSIQPITRSQDVVLGEYIGESAFTTRYAFTTNALPVRRGDNYAMLNLYGPEVHFAVSDHMSVGAMSTWLGSPLALALKYSRATPVENLHVSAGALLGTSGYLDAFVGRGSLLFGNVTWGDRKTNISFSAGYLRASVGEELIRSGAYTNSLSYFDPSDAAFDAVRYDARSWGGGPILSVAGVAKIGPKASVVFDSMLCYFSGSNNDNDFVTETLVPEVWDPASQTLIPGVYRHTVTELKRTSEVIPLFILMPGMRFERTETKAFQFNLAGVSFVESGNRRSFPFPMCTWFYGF